MVGWASLNYPKYRKKGRMPCKVQIEQWNARNESDKVADSESMDLLDEKDDFVPL